MWMVNYAAPGVAIAGLGVTYYALMRKNLDLDRQNEDYAAYILDILAKNNTEGDSVCNTSDDGIPKSKSNECITSKFKKLSLNEKLKRSKIYIRSRSVVQGKRHSLTQSVSQPLSLSTPPSNCSSTKLLTEKTKKPLSASHTYLKTKIEALNKCHGNPDGLNSVTCSDTKIQFSRTPNEALTVDHEVENLEHKIRRRTADSNSSIHFSQIFVSSESDLDRQRRKETCLHPADIGKLARTSNTVRTIGSEESFHSRKIESNETFTCSCDSFQLLISPCESISQNFESMNCKDQEPNNARIKHGPSQDSVPNHLNNVERRVLANKNEDKSNDRHERLEHDNPFAHKQQTSIFSEHGLVVISSASELKSTSYDSHTEKVFILEENGDNTDSSDCEGVSKNASVITVIRSPSPICYFTNPRYGQRFACKDSAQIAIATAISNNNVNPEKECKSRSVMSFDKFRDKGVHISLSYPIIEGKSSQAMKTDNRGVVTSKTIQEIHCSLNLKLQNTFSVRRKLYEEAPRCTNMKAKHHSNPIVLDYMEFGHGGTGACSVPCGYHDSTQFLLPPVLSDSIISTCIEDPVPKRSYNLSSSPSVRMDKRPCSKSIDYLHLHELAVENILRNLKSKNKPLINSADRIQSLPDILQRDHRYGLPPSWNNMSNHYSSVQTWLNWKSMKLFLCSKSFSFNISLSNTSLFKMIILFVSVMIIIIFLLCYLTPFIYSHKPQPPPPVQSSSWHW